MPMNLNEKVAVVTGAAVGIGAAVARRFAADGAKVILGDIDGEAAERVAAEIRDRRGIAIAHTADVTVDAEVRGLIAAAVDAFGGLDVLVNNAGVIAPHASVVDLDEREWDRVWAVNVKAGFLCSKHAIGHMVSRGGGVVLFTSSAAGLMGAQGQIAYCASKAAVINMVRTMALDHGRQGVRVNCVCPGPTLTPTLLAELPDEAALAQRAARIPLGGRLAEPEEIAAVFAYLASEEASFVTGQAIAADGGLAAGMFRPRPAPVSATR
jgi:NAD(P)-dependent dehydrogenase (short-subunit alcohol dehydrogenase family)